MGRLMKQIDNNLSVRRKQKLVPANQYSGSIFDGPERTEEIIIPNVSIDHDPLEKIQ